MRPHKSLYFIADARRSSVKIGISTDADKRLRDLQAGNHTKLRLELNLLFTHPAGAAKLEDALHQHFALYWRHREWFTYAPPVRAYVAGWIAGEKPQIPTPDWTCKQIYDEHGVGLSKEDYLARLRARARKAAAT